MVWKQFSIVEVAKKFFNRLRILYHYALKRLIGLPTFYRNHHACDHLGRLTFAYLMKWRIFKIFVGLCRSENPCITRLKTNMSRFSSLYVAVKNLVHETYSIVDMFENNLDTVFSRMFSIQARELLKNCGVPQL